jgi:hypothetical protein
MKINSKNDNQSLVDERRASVHIEWGVAIVDPSDGNCLRAGDWWRALWRARVLDHVKPLGNDANSRAYNSCLLSERYLII